jgi:hypothetical protein
MTQENANPDSAYAQDDRRTLMTGTAKEQRGRYAAMLWLETELTQPRRPHREERGRRALVQLEALYEAQWLELAMAVGHEDTVAVRRGVESEFERSLTIQL